MASVAPAIHANVEPGRTIATSLTLENKLATALDAGPPTRTLLVFAAAADITSS